MLYAFFFSIVLSTSAYGKSDMAPATMAKTVVRATNVIRSQDKKKDRLKSLKTLRDAMTLAHKRNLGRGKNSYKARYFYFVMKPVLEIQKTSQCEDVRQKLLYADQGPSKSNGQQDILPETKYPLDLLDAVCG